MKLLRVQHPGTEYGMYISYDDGASWKPFQQNLPVVPITDLTIKENDLIVATQGRAFWAIDDLSTVQGMNEDVLKKPLHVFAIEPAYRLSGDRASFGTVRNAGTNPPAGVVVNYYAKAVDDSTKAAFTILDSTRREIRTYTSDAKEAAKKMEVVKGMNTATWNLRYPESETIEGMILWNGNPGGIIAAPHNEDAA